MYVCCRMVLCCKTAVFVLSVCIMVKALISGNVTTTARPADGRIIRIVEC